MVKAYKKNKSGEKCWEYKILYKCFFTGKALTKRKRGFKSKGDCEAAALEMMGILKNIER